MPYLNKYTSYYLLFSNWASRLVSPPSDQSSPNCHQSLTTHIFDARSSPICSSPHSSSSTEPMSTSIQNWISKAQWAFHLVTYNFDAICWCLFILRLLLNMYHLETLCKIHHASSQVRDKLQIRYKLCMFRYRVKVDLLKDVFEAFKIVLESCWPCYYYSGVIEELSHNPSVWWRKDEKTGSRLKMVWTERRFKSNNTLLCLTASHDSLEKTIILRATTPCYKSRFQRYICRFKSNNTLVHLTTSLVSQEKTTDLKATHYC